MQTGAHAAHHAPGRAWQPKHGLMGGAHLKRQLGLYFGLKEAYIRKKIVLKSECNQSYGSPDI